MKKMQMIWDHVKKLCLLQRRGINKFSQIVERMKYFDLASFFQKWQQYTISLKEKNERSKKHGT